MKIRTLIVAILGVLVVSSVSPAQDIEAPELRLQEPVLQEAPSPEPRPQPSSVRQSLPPSSVHVQTSRPARILPKPPTITAPTARSTQMRTTILELEYADAADLAKLIATLFRTTPVHVDRRLNRLVVSATPERLKSIEELVFEMDAGSPEASTPRDIQNLVYRVYMFEIASEDEGMKPFSMTLQASAQVPSHELLDATEDDGLQISEFLQSDHKVPTLVDGNEIVREFLQDDPKVSTEILIQGKAASNGSLKSMVDRFPDSHITELKWDDAETFTSEVAVAEFTQLPAEMQKHIAKFLGFGVQTVGYWFGNVSVPGEIEAPIGPWELSMSLEAESDRMLEIGISVVIPGQIYATKTGPRRSLSHMILSNKIRTKIGKPIIIGYNRESYGTRKMGAMVIIPEADSVQPDTVDKKRF